MEAPAQPGEGAASGMATTPPPDTPVKNNSGRKRAGVVILFFFLAGLFLGGKWWLQSRTEISTDNAFVEARIYSVSARVPGMVASVAVKDNQAVKQGDTLVELDPADYRLRVDNAAAELEMARNETSGDYARVAGARATVNLATARRDQADLDLRRGRALFGKEVIPREQLDRLETASRIAASQLREAEESVHREEALIGASPGGGNEARIRQKQSRLDEAALNLSYVQIKAPVDGYVTRKGVEPGNNIQAGQTLLALVALDDAWITANYKESQLTHVQPGQQVTFTVDSYPGALFRGTVESIMAGTGAAFSLLPPENATGNYVKVVQRIPVRIAIDQKSDPDHLLRVGMSVVPTIKTGRSYLDALRDLNPFR
jgi:membrane fusion protein (multidrug efflux system)